MSNLHAVHYSLATQEWTFEFENGVRHATRIRPVAERLAEDFGLPINKRGYRLTSLSPPGGESVIV
jgi:hypothetical protein